MIRNETQAVLRAAGKQGSAYDQSLKTVWMNKEVLIPLLQMLIPEYQGCSQEEILKYLDQESVTGMDPVGDLPDVGSDIRIRQESSELSSIADKTVRFDIRFKALNPRLTREPIRVNLHFDLEGQLSYRPGSPSYPIIKRAVYYVARDLSSQLGVLTHTTDYAVLEKCYSIWICTENIPIKLQNTVTEYSFRKQDLIGVCEEKEEDYDLMTVVIIRRGKEADGKEIFDYLESVFSGNLEKLAAYSKIHWSESFREEVKTMTGFGDVIFRDAMQRGLEQGMQKGIQKGIQKGMQKERQNSIQILLHAYKKFHYAESDLVEVLMEGYQMTETEAKQMIAEMREVDRIS